MTPILTVQLSNPLSLQTYNLNLFQILHSSFSLFLILLSSFFSLFLILHSSFSLFLILLSSFFSRFQILHSSFYSQICSFLQLLSALHSLFSRAQSTPCHLELAHLLHDDVVQTCLSKLI